MKKLATLAAVMSLTAGAAIAGGLEAPVVEAEPMVVEEQAGTTNAGLIVPALLLLGVIAAASSDS